MEISLFYPHLHFVEECSFPNKTAQALFFVRKVIPEAKSEHVFSCAIHQDFEEDLSKMRKLYKA